MNIDLGIYKNKIRNIFLNNRFLRIDPYDNWLVLSFVFVLINIVFLTQTILNFYKISSDDASLFKENVDVRIETVNRSELSDVLINFQKLNQNHNNLKSNRPVFSDPLSR
jgi:hypothetical protein